MCTNCATQLGFLNLSSEWLLHQEDVAPSHTAAPYFIAEARLLYLPIRP
jgi:hypothetical protein